MKHHFFTFIFISALISCTCSSLLAQQKANLFDVKKRKSAGTVGLNFSQRVIHGSNSQAASTSLNKNISQAISTNRHSDLRTASKDQVVISGQTGLPIFISGGNTTSRTSSTPDKRTACYAYLGNLKSILKISDPERQFTIKSIRSDSNGSSHIRMDQEYKGIRIYGAEVLVHLNTSGIGETFNGNYHLIGNDIDTVPSLHWKKALEIIVSDLSGKTTYRTLNADEKRLLDYSAPEVDTVIFQNESKKYVLAYHVSIIPNLRERWEYFIDATSSTILDSYKSTCHVDGPKTASAVDLNGVTRTINTYQENTNYLFEDASKSMFISATKEGIIFTLDANATVGDNFKVQDIISSNNVWNNPKAVSAHYNAGKAFDYYKNTHSRNSIDGKGGSIFSVINVVDEDGSAMDNAYWNGKAMFYGNGNTNFKPLAGGLDVGGHEMTHGVVQNTANLVYQGESGAINESMADVFGCMMDPEDWTIGEDVVNINIYPTKALRSLMNPHNGGNSLSDAGYQPMHMNEKYTGSQDNHGVHINSGIPNYAYYLFATAIGKAKAEQVYYKALSTYLTQNSQFIDLRLAVVKSAKELYGDAASTQAGLAFDAVGISEKTQGTYTTTLPINPGLEHLLLYNTEDSDDNGLYRVDGENFAPLTGKIMLNKPSVTDDGNYAVFVGTDNKIYGINVNPDASAVPVVIQDQAIWYNVAVSKDGNRIAAITLDTDTSIYIFDLEKGTNARFMLYNPTFSDGIKSEGPLYSDALEWDYTGESIIYDAYNRISNTNGSKIEYWDINLMHVWDNATSDFSDGTVFKIISNLDQGENIGNPTFSKNSPHIIAFDYFNLNDSSSSVIGYDIELNNLNIITSNNTLGHPTFNRNDDHVALTMLDDSGNSCIGLVTLMANKISPAGSVVIAYTGAEWPVYYSVGIRNTTGTLDKELTDSDVSIFPNPVNDELTIQMSLPDMGNTFMEVFDQLGGLVLKKTITKMEGKASVLDVSMLPQGMYTLSLSDTTRVQKLKFIKE